MIQFKGGVDVTLTIKRIQVKNNNKQIIKSTYGRHEGKLRSELHQEVRGQMI